jgi:hypothetical protein
MAAVPSVLPGNASAARHVTSVEACPDTAKLQPPDGSCRVSRRVVNVVLCLVIRDCWTRLYISPSDVTCAMSGKMSAFVDEFLHIRGVEP